MQYLFMHSYIYVTHFITLSNISIRPVGWIQLADHPRNKTIEPKDITYILISGMLLYINIVRKN